LIHFYKRPFFKNKMNSYAESDFLSLLTPRRKIPADVLFQFAGSDETLSAHKFVLAQVSDVYYFNKFYGPLRENTKAEQELIGGVENVMENKFSFETFNIFCQHVYGDKEIDQRCSSF